MLGACFEYTGWLNPATSRRSRRYIYSPQRKLWVRDYQPIRAREAKYFESGLTRLVHIMPRAFAGWYYGATHRLNWRGGY